MRISSVCRPSRYSTPSAGQRDALLQRHPHQLTAPLGHRHPHAQLQRPDGVGVHRGSRPRRGRRPAGPTCRSPAPRRGRARRPGGSRRRRRCPRPPRRARAAASTSSPVRPGRSAAVVRSCIRLPDRQRGDQAGRRRRLAGPQHVAVALGVGASGPGVRQPDVAVHQVAGLDHRVVRDAGQHRAALVDQRGRRRAAGRRSAGTTASTPRSAKRWRIHQATSSAVVCPTVMTAGE